jgi:16S rRNA (guanine527-N7)-methyltransferase
MTNDLNVSRETLKRLRAFEALVRRWTQKINLISKGSVSEIWDRHIEDSQQIYGLAPPFTRWVDLGSGGGFPGIVIAILAQEKHPGSTVTLVESDQRKCAFLRTAIRELDLPAHVVAKRIESIEPLGADVISARALADLTVLLSFAERHLAATGTALFPKGARWQQEESDARLVWSYDSEAITSKTDPSAAILRIKDIGRV